MNEHGERKLESLSSGLYVSLVVDEQLIADRFSRPAVINHLRFPSDDMDDFLQGAHLMIVESSQPGEQVHVTGIATLLETTTPDDVNAMSVELQSRLHNKYRMVRSLDAHLVSPENNEVNYVRISSSQYAVVQLLKPKPDAPAQAHIFTITADEVGRRMGREVIPVSPESYTDESTFRTFMETWSATLESIAAVHFQFQTQQHSIALLHNPHQTSDRPKVTEARELLKAFHHESPPAATNVLSALALERAKQQEIEAKIESAFAEIGGLRSVKQRLKDIAHIIANPEEATRLGVRVPHFYLHGPEGTGKTALLNAFAQAVSATIHRVDMADINSRYVADRTRNIIDSFRAARQLATSGPVIVVIDNIEGILTIPHGRVDTHAPVINAFSSQLDDISRDFSNRIIVIAATRSRPDELDKSATRSGRLEPIAISEPNEHERAEIWGLSIKNIITAHAVETFEIQDPAWNAITKQEELAGLADLTAELADHEEPSFDLKRLSAHELSGNAIVGIIQSALLDQFTGRRRTGIIVPITQEILEAKIDQFKRS